MRELLSSRTTFFTKFVFPPLWSGIFGLVTLCMWLGVIKSKDGIETPLGLKWVFLGVWSAASVFLFRLSSKLMKVELENGELLVSNFRESIRIRGAQIAEIEIRKYQRGQPITLHLNTSTLFGNQILFIPKTNWAFWKPHPVVVRLQNLPCD